MVECLHMVYRALGLVPAPCILGVEVHTHQHSTQKVEAERSVVKRYPRTM